MNRTARHTSPCPIAEFQTRIHLSACGAGPTRCIPATDAYQVNTFPAALVLKNRIESTDTCICNTIGKMMVLEHTLHIQILDADGTHLAVVRQLMSNLMNEVEPLVGNLGINTSNMMLNFLPTGRPLRFVTQFSLVMLQAFLCRLGKMRCSELTAVRADCKGFHASVYTDSGSLLYNGT